ncbi:PepSY domain-containing protein [Shewanella amazonensis]|uniref:Iron-regulated membrane protein n=1 Tax=Shewanella amazonensis (strain ATCC BAA-1098 / SB2B) TaxID=326297 RepID=A1SB56_SHEAM|nr:PepSY-associated TM helix domain-containing protein [Shewanella amazonensis]ABM01613.1 conserved hypothetical protein [Shewanella amazonensis SB2B]
MKETFFRTMTWLHTWAGLLVCWVLLLVFFAGTLSFFRHEISLYATPELHSQVLGSGVNTSLEQNLRQGQAYLSARVPDAPDWYIALPQERQPYLAFQWSEPRDKQRPLIHSQPITLSGELADEPRQTKGGDFFYRLHFDLHYISALTARYLVGICTMFMLIALITGVVIHKRIFKDFFSFRPRKGSRSWLDAHNISAVMALPFHLTITYTGLITLMLMYMPWATLSVWNGDTKAMRQELSPRFDQQKASGQPQDTLDLTLLLPQVNQLWGETAAVKNVRVQHPGDANARIFFTRDTGQDITDERVQLIFDGVTGKLLNPGAHHATGSQQLHDTLMALHTARFAGWPLRILGFVMGLMGCAMIASGCLLWATKLREKRKNTAGLKLVEGLNLAVIMGLPLGTVLFFYANRLLPAPAPGRAEDEVLAFFLGLLLCGVTALWRRDAAVWRALLGITALLALLMPVLNTLTSPQGLVGNLLSNQWVLVSADLLFIVLGITCLFARRKFVVPVRATMPAMERTA